MSTALFLLTFVASTVAAEYFVLQRWLGRRGLAACIVGGAFLSGIVWGVFTVIDIWIGIGPEAEAPPTVAEILIDFGIGSILWSLVASVIALIPAGLTAMVYRRFRGQI